MMRSLRCLTDISPNMYTLLFLLFVFQRDNLIKNIILSLGNVTHLLKVHMLQIVNNLFLIKKKI